MDNGALTSSTASGLGDKAIYHGMAPSKKVGLQVFFGFVGVAVLASLIVCFVLSGGNRVLYVLGVNQCITLANCLLLLRWYIKGTLPPNWLWYVILVGIFLLFQSTVTDIMVGEYPYTSAPTVPPPLTTLPPPITNTTRPPSNVTTLPPTTTPNHSLFEQPTTLPMLLTQVTP